MSRGRLVVHGHFYQPLRVDPFSGDLPIDPSAAPYDNWNARVAAECYRPNAERRNPSRMSWDLGPTLAAWLEDGDPKAYRGFIDGDRPSERDPAIPLTRGNGLAQPYHHAIAPLASAADRRTELRWGLRDFLVRFGRAAEGVWFPETAIDVASLRIAAEAGVRHTILAPWQAATPVDTRRPYRVELGGGRSIVVTFYDAGLSAAVSFEPDATADADRFARERVAVRMSGSFDASDGPPLVVIATDGELYGHHQPFRELFLQRLIRPGDDQPDRGFDVVDLASAVVSDAGRPMPVTRILERTSWSCHHGVLRWSGECPCARDGLWKAPLRAALDRLAAAIDVVTTSALAALPGRPDPWATRDAYIDVVLGAEPGAAFAARWVGGGAPAAARRTLLTAMEMQRWRLAMFSSDGWFWDDPMRLETRQVLRFAGRAAQLADELSGTELERRLLADLALLRSPGHGLDGAEIYEAALADVGRRPVAGRGEAQASA